MQSFFSSSPPLKAAIVEQPARVAGWVSEWGALFARSSARTPFQSPEWLLPWIQVFCPSRLRVVAVLERDRLIGLAPFLIYPRGTEQVLAFAGGGVSDYLDVLAEPGRESLVVRTVFSAVLEDTSWTTLELTDLAPHSVLLKAVPFGQFASKHDTSSVLALPADPSELVRRFSHRQRANLRNARSRLERNGGGAVECATRETISQFLEDLFRLHTMRWSEKGQAGVLHQEQLQTFHRVAAPGLLLCGLLRIYRLHLATGTAAVIYVLFDGDTAYCYLQGFDPGLAFVSPGTLLMFAVIEHAIARGMRSFDFLRGQESYKQHWHAESRSTYRICLERTHLEELTHSEKWG